MHIAYVFITTVHVYIHLQLHVANNLSGRRQLYISVIIVKMVSSAF